MKWVVSFDIILVGGGMGKADVGYIDFAEAIEK